MLVLSRKRNEVIVLETSDGPIRVVITKVGEDRVGIGIEAPKAIQILRKELSDRKEAA